MRPACCHSLLAAVEVVACSEGASSFAIFGNFRAELDHVLELGLELGLELELEWQYLGHLCAH